MGKLVVNDKISIDDSELSEAFVRASGPGGQNVNKVSTAVELRFHVASSPSLAPDVKERLAQIAGRRVGASGELLIFAQSHRTQEMNRSDARKRLVALVLRAAEPPKARVPTKPSRSSIRKRLEGKRRGSEIKASRSGRNSME